MDWVGYLSCCIYDKLWYVLAFLLRFEQQRLLFFLFFLGGFKLQDMGLVFKVFNVTFRNISVIDLNYT